LLDQVGGLIGKNGSKAIESALTASNPHTTGMVATILAIGTLILTATGLFIELQSDLNTIWHVEQKPKQGIWGFIKLRLLSFAMVVVIGFLLLVSLVVSAALAAVGKYFSGMMPGLKVLWEVLNILVSFGVITVLFAMIFKILPDIKLAWRDVWIGAGLTSLLFTIGKSLLGIYLGRNSAVTAYGTAGSLVLILLWVYYSGQILFIGAEFTKVFATRFGVLPEPKAHARWIVPKPAIPQLAAAAAAGKPHAQLKPRDPKELLLTQIREEVEGLKSIHARMTPKARQT